MINITIRSDQATHLVQSSDIERALALMMVLESCGLTVALTPSRGMRTIEQLITIRDKKNAKTGKSNVVPIRTNTKNQKDKI